MRSLLDYRHVATCKTKTGLAHSFQYMLKVTNPARSRLNVLSWLSYGHFYIIGKFLIKHVSHVTSPVVSLKSYLHETSDLHSKNTIISNSELRKLSTKCITGNFLLRSNRSNTIKDTLKKRRTRRSCSRGCKSCSRGCNGQHIPPKKRELHKTLHWAQLQH